MNSGFKMKFIRHGSPYLSAMGGVALFIVEGLSFALSATSVYWVVAVVEYYGTELPKRYHLLNTTDFLPDLPRKGNTLACVRVLDAETYYRSASILLAS